MFKTTGRVKILFAIFRCGSTIVLGSATDKFNGSTESELVATDMRRGEFSVVRYPGSCSSGSRRASSSALLALLSLPAVHGMRESRWLPSSTPRSRRCFFIE